MNGIRTFETKQRKLGYEVLESRRLLAALIGSDVIQPMSDSMGIWSRVDQPHSDFGLRSVSPAQKYMLHSLKVDLLQRNLSFAPQETFLGDQPSAIISIPSPSGEFNDFEFFASSIMAPELAAQFPEIQTYAGRGISDPLSTVRFDLTPAGFHAQVLSPNGTYYVDPYGEANANALYATYFKADAIRRSSFDEHELADSTRSSLAQTDTTVPDQATALSAAQPMSAFGSATSTVFRSGAQLRTYRAAIAATGEYTAFFGGTVAQGQAAIVTAMNRVNAVFENEFSIRMVLVGNNSSLVYTNSLTDPYTNDNTDLLYDENQVNVDAVIGNANYDIGHVFSFGGGGLAGLGSAGIDGQKANGVSGSDPPVNDAFWVGYVGHEMGHQFGAEHTFNSTRQGCGGNRARLSAYEPGSGSTIMSYVGLCGSDDLQVDTDPYFHSISFDEVIAHVDNVIPTVGTRTATGNSVPTVNAGSDYTIPANTPFVLTATGTDANTTDVLTYNWEQRDLGPAQRLIDADNGTSPLFRSYLPTTNPTRTFPRLSNLVNNTLPKGEQLPQTTRALNFRATVRDNAPGGGGVNTDDTRVNVVVTGQAFAVTSPNSNVSWTGLSTQTVTWNVAGTTANGINTANVNILLSIDGGLTYPTVIMSNVPNDGSQNIIVPTLATTQARIRVQGAGNIFFDISDVNFTITLPPVVNRQVFYNRSPSSLFGNGTGNPMNSIDSSKQALLPGQTATFDNVSNYSRGLNGLVIDLANAGTSITAADFQFATSNGSTPLTFTNLAATPIISVFSNGGISNSRRVKIEFNDSVIKNTWLRVTVLANANTGLTSSDVFYFGSAVGEMNAGNLTGPPIQLRTNSIDTGTVRQNQSTIADSVNVTRLHDINKDGRVNSIDTGLVRQNQSTGGSIFLFTAPGSIQIVNSPSRIDSAMTDLSWLESFGSTSKNRQAKRG